MSPRNPRPARERRRLKRLTRTAGLAAVLVTGLGCWSLVEDSGDSAAPVAAARVDHKPGYDTAAERPPAPLARARATLLALPGITVEAPVVALPLAGTAVPAAPALDDPEAVAWHANGPSPGERGTAVIVGRGGAAHGPGVLHGLGALQRGNTVRVTRADGLTAVFTVEEVRAHTAGAVPRDEAADRATARVRVIAVDGGSGIDVRGRLTDVTREK
ncbi:MULTISPECIES: class F sortase [Streptomyces]|uniref:Class F sortase n=1 Tax=Streptomyces solicathayae TaxID=3081768 RepID=A0ABZ0M0K6_9ACTN|nr:class F sortase [Streptomyces sp. HUAS YS2]WOX25286.1 class F sortase [Streptomyces sp. HUAS YS2]